MYSQSSMDHIVRDLIVRWQRTMMAIMAMAVGLIVWLTFFFYAGFAEPVRSEVNSNVTGSVPESSPTTVIQFLEKRVLNDPSVTDSTVSVHSRRRQQADPLARSIEVSAVHSNDFRTRIIPLSISTSNSSHGNDASSTRRNVSPSFRSGTSE